MARAYVPERGDIVWVDLDRRVGHEQAGHRPALVLSPAAYNGRTGLALMCPITSRIKDYPFEVRIAAGRRIDGVVLADHVKTLDWRYRKARFAAKAHAEVVDEVRAKLLLLI